jgi:fluoride exporter
MDRLFLVFLGGGLGSALRYGVGLLCTRAFGDGFPVATLLVNCFGCFAMGVLMQFAQGGTLSPILRAALAIGFLGGFTTYSSFNYETAKLFEDGDRGQALLNLFATLFGCALSGLLGSLWGRRLSG